MHYDEIRSAGAMEEYNRTRCTPVVDRSKTVQNQKVSEWLLEMHFNDCHSAGAIEEYNGTHCMHLVYRSKTIQNQKAFEDYPVLRELLLRLNTG